MYPMSMEYYSGLFSGSLLSLLPPIYVTNISWLFIPPLLGREAPAIHADQLSSGIRMRWW